MFNIIKNIFRKKNKNKKCAVCGYTINDLQDTTVEYMKVDNSIGIYQIHSQCKKLIK